MKRFKSWLRWMRWYDQRHPHYFVKLYALRRKLFGTTASAGLNCGCGTASGCRQNCPDEI